MSLVGAVSLTNKTGVFLGSVNLDNLNLQQNQIAYSSDGTAIDGTNNFTFDGTSKLHLGEALGFSNTYQTNIEAVTNANQSTQNFILQNKSSGAVASTNLYVTNDATVSQDSNYGVIGMNGSNYAGANYVTEKKSGLYIANTNSDLALSVNAIGSGAGIHLSGDGGVEAISINPSNAISLGTTYDAGTDTYTYNCGNLGQVLTSAGASAKPTWTTPASGISIANQADTRIPIETATSNSLTSSANLTFNTGTNTLSAPNLTVTNINTLPPVSITAQSANRIITATSTTNTLHSNQDLNWDGLQLSLFNSNPLSIGRGNNASSAATNTAVGASALNAISSGSGNTCIGSNAGLSLATGNNVTIVGSQTSQPQTTNSSVTIVGAANTITTSADSSTVVGAVNDRIANSSVIVGKGSKGGNSANNIVIGVGSGSTSTQQQTIVIGNDCYTRATAGGNCFIGHNTGRSGGTGTLSGQYNTAVSSFSALDNLTSGSQNCAFGQDALKPLTTGGNNTAIGFQSGLTLTTGSNNTLLGYQAAASAAGVSNEVTIGNASVANLRVPGLSLDATANRFKTAGHYAGSVPVTITADTTVSDSTFWLINNKSGSTCTLTLPAAGTWSGRILNIHNYQTQLVVSASSNVVPLGGGSAGTAILSATPGSWCTLISDGTNWITLQG